MESKKLVLDLLEQEVEDFIQTQAEKVIEFEDDPMAYILNKYPSLNDTLTDLMTKHFGDYVTGIYVMAPKPTTFKILLHNGQFYYLIYAKDSYIAKIMGKKYYLLDLGAEEYAIKAIADLLTMGKPPGAKGPDDQEDNVTITDKETTTDVDITDDGGGDEEDLSEAKEKDTETDDYGRPFVDPKGSRTYMDPDEMTPAARARKMMGEKKIKIVKESIEKKKSPLKFKILKEVKGDATLFEAALVVAWYEINKKEIPSSAVEKRDIDKLSSDMIEDAKNVLKSANLTGGNFAQHLGSGTAQTTEFWQSFGATNKTPKTDLIIGDNKISLKVGSSQLMSGAGNELTATFYAALKNSPNTRKEIIDEITNDIEDVFVKGTTKAGNVRQAKQAGDDPILNKAVEKMGILKKEIEELLENDSDFKTEFAYEAATGAQKFGGNEGTANSVLAVASDYSKGKLNPITKEYASEIANKMKLDINMKSGSEKLNKIKTGRYNYFSVLRAGLQDLFKDASDDIQIDNSINFN